MTPEQAAAFAEGAGGLAAGEWLLTIAMIVMTLFTLWTAWVTLGQSGDWLEGRESAFDLLWLLLRASILLLLLGFFIRP